MGQEEPNSASMAATATSAAAITPSERVRSEQIDEMRSRVDAVLAAMCGATTTMTKSTTTTLTSAGPISLTPADLTPNQTWVVDPYGDQGPYEGDLERKPPLDANGDESSSPTPQLPHGMGIMHYTDGRVYQGQWKFGQWHGLGKAVFSNIDTYEGQYFEDQRHGAGIYRWSDGRVYQGEFHKDQRHGFGVYTWPDGAKYEGHFSKGLRHGNGAYTFRDGSVYDGEWQRGRYHGPGRCQWADGRVYDGEWVNGMAHGQGMETRPDGSVRHDGIWENDKPVRHDKLAVDSNGINGSSKNLGTTTTKTTLELLEGTATSKTTSISINPMDMDS